MVAMSWVSSTAPSSVDRSKVFSEELRLAVVVVIALRAVTRRNVCERTTLRVVVNIVVVVDWPCLWVL